MDQIKEVELFIQSMRNKSQEFDNLRDMGGLLDKVNFIHYTETQKAHEELQSINNYIIII